MRYTDAHWEIRNLGVRTVEITIESSDTLNDLSTNIDNVDYVVVKLPVALNQWIFDLQNLDYKFAELLTLAKFGLGRYPILNGVEIRVLQRMSYLKKDKNDLEEIFKQINFGMFETDRISLDPKFGIEYSKNRYCGLVMDEIKFGANLYCLQYNNIDIGFFLIRKSGFNCISNLAGIFNEHKSKGLGIYLNYFEIVESQKLSSKNLLTAFSSNNLGAERVHNYLGFRNTNQFYIFVKHFN